MTAKRVFPTEVVPRRGRHIPHRPWLNAAACRDKPSHWWFPTKPATTQVRADIAAAKAVCGTCPVRDDCLDHSLRWEVEGIWGGSTARERRVLRRQRRIPLLYITPEAR